MRTREEPSSTSCGYDELREGPLSHRGAAMVSRPLSDNERVLSRATPVKACRSSVTYSALSDLAGMAGWKQWGHGPREGHARSMLLVSRPLSSPCSAVWDLV